MTAADIAPRMLLVVVAVVAVASLALTVPSSGAQPDPIPPEAETQPTPVSLKIVTVDSNSRVQLWPYTSRGRSFDEATLPINVVVMRDAAYVRYLLASSEQAHWEVSDPAVENGSAGNESSIDSGVVLNGTSIEWTGARGSTRYTYFHDESTGRGWWVEETYQLHDGAYFGTRYHLRLYEGGTGSNRWTAIQGHREHWDWFRLRHTVGSVARAQTFVEHEFYGQWFLADIERQRYANGGAIDADGWVTVIRLTDRGVAIPVAVVGLIVGWPSIQRVGDLEPAAVLEALRTDVDDVSLDPNYLPLVAGIATLPLAIRVAGITIEGAFPELSPVVIARGLYPAIALGIPLGAYAFSRRLPAGGAGIAAATALGAGMVADYTYMDIQVLPIDIVVHRAMLLVAIGCIAAGASRASGDGVGTNRLVGIGATAWLLGLFMPLLGVI